VFDWGDYYVERIQAMLDGTWTSTDTLHGVTEGMIGFAPMRNMPKDIAGQGERTIMGLKNGLINPFTGPINKQDGSPWLAEGETASIGDLMSMMFYVEGIDSQFPN
jgi:simple sugar transport system substrate-binding protein